MQSTEEEKRVVSKFYLEQSQYYSLGDNISDSSEKLVWRDRGEVHRYVILVKGDTWNKTYIFAEGCC